MGKGKDPKVSFAEREPIVIIVEGRSPKGGVTRPLRADSRERPAILNLKGAAFPPRPKGQGFHAVENMNNEWKSLKDQNPEQGKPYLIYEVYPPNYQIQAICVPLIGLPYKLAEWSDYYKGFVSRNFDVYKYAAFFRELPDAPTIEEKP